MEVAVYDTFKCFIHKFFTIRDSRGWGKIDYVDLGQLILAKNWKLLHQKWCKSQFFKYIFSIFCFNELAQINRIYLPPTPGVPNSEKFMENVFESIKYSHFQKVVILSISIHSFNILPKVLNPKCYTILESIFDALWGGKVKCSTFRSF